MRFYFDATRGYSAIDWRMANGGDPPLEPPDEYWEIESDRREELCSPESPCLDDFETSLEPD